MANAPHALRLDAALRAHLGNEAADAFMQAHALNTSAAPDKKFSWACQVCADLTALAPDEAAAIRRDCRCNDGRTMARQISACIHKAGSLAAGCALFSQENPYAFLEYVSDNELRFGYHACVCSCVKRVEGTLPRLWCECSCGYAEAMFRQVLGEAVQVELVGSVRAGDARCEMSVFIPRQDR